VGGGGAVTPGRLWENVGNAPCGAREETGGGLGWENKGPTAEFQAQVISENQEWHGRGRALARGSSSGMMACGTNTTNLETVSVGRRTQRVWCN